MGKKRVAILSLLLIYVIEAPCLMRLANCLSQQSCLMDESLLLSEAACLHTHPSLVSAFQIGQIFDVHVKVGNLLADWGCQNVIFDLSYNHTLIGVTALTVDPMWGVSIVNDSAGMLQVDVGSPSSIPSGEALIMEIQFAVLLQGVYPEVYACELHFDNINLLGTSGEIPTNRCNGLVLIYGRVLSEYIDLYGGAENNGYGPYPNPFPHPYSGHGSQQPMDLVTPASLIILCAAVTNDTWPLQNINVTFLLEGPEEYSSTADAVTDEEGVAYLTFEMPWPQANPESLLGLWKATATAIIGEVVVADLMFFFYHYLVDICGVTTDKSVYEHGELVEISIVFKTLSIQYYPCLLVISTLDSSNVTIGYAWFNITIGGSPEWGVPQWTEYVLQIVIPSYAHSGDAIIVVDCFDRDPESGGLRWCPQFQGFSAFVIQGLYRDVGVTSFAPTNTVAHQGYSLDINIAVVNQGDYIETFNTTLYANTTDSYVIGKIETTLNPAEEATLTFTWNTTGFAYGNYTVWAYAEPVENETYLEDNTFVGGWVFVAGPGDLNADGLVDIFDLVTVALALGSEPGDPNWNPNADIIIDAVIDIFDLVAIAVELGQAYTYP